MADVSLIVEVKQKGVTEAVKGTKTLERNVKLLSDSLQKGSLSQRQYYKGVAELAQATNKTESELRKYATQIRATEKASKLAKEAARAEADAVKLYAQARRDATEANRRFDAEARKAVRTAKENATANRRLRMEFKEGYAAQVQLRAAQMRLNQARRQGIITDAEYKKQLGSLSIATQVAGRRMNSTGMAMQQTGYQVGDFLVQVQGGTNAMVAFGQQATQLVGILPMFNSFMGLSGTSLVALSAGLGIAIPLLTAIGAAFMRTRPPAEKAKTTYEGVKDSLDAIEGVNFSGLGSEFLDIAKDIKSEFNDILNVIEQVARRDLEKSLTAPLKAVIAEAESFQTRAILLTQIGSDTPEFGGAFGLESMNEAIFLATQLKRLNGETKEELQGQLEAVTEALFYRGILTEEVQKTLAGLAAEVSLMEDLNSESQERSEKAEDYRERLTRIRGVMGEINAEGSKLAKDIMDAYKSGEDLSNLNIGKGIDSAAESARVLAERMGITLGLAKQLVALSAMAPEERRLESGITAGIVPPWARGDTGVEGGETPLALQSYIDSVDARVKEKEGAAKAGESDNGVSAFMQQFLTDGEQLDIWREDQLAKLQEFNANELALLQAHGINKASIEEDYKNKVQAIKAMERTETLNNYASLFGALGSLMGSEGRKMLKVQAAISGAATMINAYEAASKAAAKAPDPITAASVWAGFVAKGIATVAKIKSLGSGGSPSGSAGGSISGGASTSSPSSQSMATPQAAPKDQRVLIKGLGPKDLLTGEMLQELFDKLYDENQERGAVFMVST